MDSPSPPSMGAVCLCLPARHARQSMWSGKPLACLAEEWGENDAALMERGLVLTVVSEMAGDFRIGGALRRLEGRGAR